MRGGRPQFDVVTGISTGALMATHAFLGPEFDDDLANYKDISNDDVFIERSILGTIKGTSALDTAPPGTSQACYLLLRRCTALASPQRRKDIRLDGKILDRYKLTYPRYQGNSWLLAELCFVAEEVGSTGNYSGMPCMRPYSGTARKGISQPSISPAIPYRSGQIRWSPTD